MHRFILFLSIILFFSDNILIQGQSKGINREKYRINIKQTGEKINIDGILGENSWMTAECTGKFQRVTPTDTGYAIAQTEVRLTRAMMTAGLSSLVYLSAVSVTLKRYRVGHQFWPS